MQTAQQLLITKLSGNETQGAVNKQLRAEWGLHGGSCIGYKRLFTLAVDEPTGLRDKLGSAGGGSEHSKWPCPICCAKATALSWWETQDPEIWGRVI